MRSKHELILASTHDRIAQQLLKLDNSPWYIPNETKRFLLAESGWCCAICKKHYDDKSMLHIDHRIPVSRGGTACYNNLQVLCRSCNLIKSNHGLDPRSYALGYPIPIRIETEETINRKVLERLYDDYS